MTLQSTTCVLIWFELSFLYTYHTESLNKSVRSSSEFHTRVQLFSLANFNRTREQFFVLVAAIVYAHQPGLCEAWH